MAFFNPDLWHSLCTHVARLGVMGLLINDELEGAWKEAILRYSREHPLN